jgi:uncharacterized protein
METLLVAMFGAGLASGVHCVAMCGGIVTAFDAGARPVIPIRPAAGAGIARRLAFNAGRISTYAAAGFVAGFAGEAAYAAGALPVQDALALAANLLLIAVGLHLLTGRVLASIEALGRPLWRRVQPFAGSLLKGPSSARAYAAGLAWGWLPCAMVYAALAGAAASGDPLRGAAAMAVFGGATLPFLLAAGWLAARVRRWRRFAAATLLGFGAYGLAQAGTLGESIRQNIFCF